MLTLIIGGSGSGKSTYAEGLVCAYPGEHTYVACMLPYGEEGAARVRRHRALRAGKGFCTVERYTDIGGAPLPENGVALVECLCNLTANEIFEENGAHEKTFDSVVNGISVLNQKCRALFVVTNDVSSGGDWNSDPETAEYVETLGRINATLAVLAERVIEVVCGIPIVRKGEMP